MRKFLSGVIATALAASFAIASVLPLNAAPVYVPKAAPAASNNVDNIQYRRCRSGRGCFSGYRGYRTRRPGYRYYNGWWIPAIIGGAIIGGALAQPPVRYRPRYGGDAHVEWCYSRYRSYRAYDNTYQPYNGPRRQCYSPYS